MLSATGLKKRYKQREVVRDFSCRVEQGEVVGLLGPNGAGKTTCFYMIVGLVGADAGNIRLDDTDITAQPMHARARLGVGYLPQEASIFRRLTVAENILAILELRPELDANARAATLAALPALEILNLKQTRLDDDGLNALSKAPKLMTIDISNTSVADSAIENFKAAKPGRNVTY